MLICAVRHGTAVDGAGPDRPSDPARYLTEEGVKQGRESARGLRALGLAPAAILSSPYVRAVQTAELAAEVFGYPAGSIRQTEALLPGAAPQTLLDELARLDRGPALCVGHAPHLDLFIGACLGVNRPVTALKKAGAACVELDGLNPPSGVLMWALPPQALRRLGAVAG